MKKVLVFAMTVLAVLSLAWAAQNFVSGAGLVTYSNAGSAISSGELVDLGNRYGVALNDIAASTGTGTVATEGIFELVRSETNAVTAGTPLYRASATAVSITAVAGKYVGLCVESVSGISTATLALATSKVKVELNPMKDVDAGVLADGDLGDVSVSSGAASIDADAVTEADLKAVDSAADEDFLTYESTTGDFEWHSVADKASAIAAAVLTGVTTNQAFINGAGTTNTMHITNGVIYSIN